MKRILIILSTFYYSFLYLKNRLIFSLIGVHYGSNFKTLSGTSVSGPHNLTIGNNVWIGKQVNLRADSGIIIGNNIMIADYASIITFDHNSNNIYIPISQQGSNIHKNNCVFIGDGVWIGEKAIILKRVKIGEGAIVGAGSVVTKDVKKYTIVAGNPARVINKRKHKK